MRIFPEITMLEGLVAWVLNNYLGKYVENLNTDQLSIALLSGQVELENLPLKKDALRHIGLPVEIKAGFIGKIKLQVPVRQIRSAPWVIIIEQLYLVASPLPLKDWDAAREEIRAHELKLSALDAIEARWRIETDSKESTTYYASTYSSWLSFGSGVFTDIIENLQLKIRDVHIRYEDDISIADKPVAFGVTVESLSAQSCDENWLPGFSHWDSSANSFKLLEMHKLAIYWTTLTQDDLLSNLTLAELAVMMSQTKNCNYSHHYILTPVSAQAHIKRNRSEEPLRSHDKPRIICDLHLEEVPLTLIDWQYEHMVKCTRGLDDIARFRSYRRFRPLMSVKDDPKAWWLYAISCNFPDKLPRICKAKPTWISCLERGRENVEYVKIHMKILSTPTTVLSSEHKKLKDAVEWNREYDELKDLREVAMRLTPIGPVTKNVNEHGILRRWFPLWRGWYSTGPADSTTVTNQEPTQLEGEILEAFQDSIENNTILKRDAVFGQFNFSLKSGSVNLCTQEAKSMLELQFKSLSLNIVSKPRSASHLVELSLGAMYLKDKLTPGTLFPILVGPPGQERFTQNSRSKMPSPRLTAKIEDASDSLFYLAYEKKPENLACDYRLQVRSKPLDVVYQPAAAKWLIEFVCRPHQRMITQNQIEAMKSRTKKELIKNWEQIINGRSVGRINWHLELDISAPQIIFVEKFTDSNSSVAVVDFGRMQLVNIYHKQNIPLVPKESEEDETFMTPCSTPPGSEASTSESYAAVLKSLPQYKDETLDENVLRQKLYDQYSVELTDMQVLVGRVKDNWRYAHNKGTSTLHVLDRFNISLQIERRVVHTCDPLYPSLTLSGNLPKLVVHLNEQKISAARNLTQIIKATSIPSPFGNGDDVEIPLIMTDDEESLSIDTSLEMSRLLIFQFTIDQLSLEVQSRGRSVAELQVSGVKAAFTKRPFDIGITLTVHSLLLVDALQTFGPDFELLLASHKHVGMDSMSGSLRDSEPTSPTSPGSPDPTVTRITATSPIAITQALSNLAQSPTHSFVPISYLTGSIILDAEALITIEVTIVTGLEQTHIANIQFNNLDVIANQETIVELLGFARRVFPELKPQKPNLPNRFEYQSVENLKLETPKVGHTELTFDFHRLNILLLRGVIKDGYAVGKKIATATMSEAKIQATVGANIIVEGSLGGLQVLDLTSEGHLHQRIISVGRNPVCEASHPLYAMSQTVHEEERRAFSFQVTRNLDENDVAEITVRMASVWYTHSPHFVMELQSCAIEFKQYLANLARSIRSAATDMALGLVHARAEALAHSLSINSRLSASIYGSALSFSEIMSPRKRRRSNSFDQPDSASGYSSVRDTIPHTPFSPDDNDDFIINLKLDIVLDSPVVVLPRASNNPEVFVAHLGKITVKNLKPETSSFDNLNNVDSRLEHYELEVKDMNLFSLDTGLRRVPGPMMNKAEILYSCETLAKPILHDTIVHLKIEREICYRERGFSELLDDDDNSPKSELNNEYFQITGTVITPLKLSLTRLQYEQLLDTWQWITAIPSSSVQEQSRTNTKFSTLADISEEDTGVTTLKMDPHVRAKLFPTYKNKETSTKDITYKVLFELPAFIIELFGDTPQGELPLVDLTFEDFSLNYEKCHQYETNVQVSLRSILMEDLLQPTDSKQRVMVVSSSGGDLPSNYANISRSCPDISGRFPNESLSHGSLPDHLEPIQKEFMAERKKVSCPHTPPPSPSMRERPQKNLVLVSTLLVDPSAPNFHTYYNYIQRSTSVDFNCLDLVVSVESWVVVIDFFSATPSHSSAVTHPVEIESKQENGDGNSETNISVRSLTMTLVKPDRDVARVTTAHFDVSIKTVGLRKEVEGRLGSMSLLDLTHHGQFYRERFATSGKQALHFEYIRFAPGEEAKYDAQLTIHMSSVLYIHTKRFAVEIYAFFNHFTQLQTVMQSIRAATSGRTITDETNRLSIVVQAGAPVILLPESSKSSEVLIADLGKLLLTNSFQYSEVENGGKACLLDVMTLELQNVDLFTGTRSAEGGNNANFQLGNCVITKHSSSLLTEKCHLKLEVCRNLDSHISHNVPDLTIHGQLSTLDVALDLSQYHLIKNFLSYNLGEDTEHILSSVSQIPTETNANELWTLSSLGFELSNVILRLQLDHEQSPLARINFIKSHLTIETYSNFSQDIDLISQEILIMDTRYENSPANKRSNVFTNILQPINFSAKDDVVQAEVHSRKRHDLTKFTILLNNMRLMAIFDWWEVAKNFILNDFSKPPESADEAKTFAKQKSRAPFELNLNVTDSEVVVVENTAQWDTNAVILKSTTVLSYKPFSRKIMSCNLNNCEMYSCVLGMEDETALSIIDPVMLNMEINNELVLEIQLQMLTIRLSYHDMRLFSQILNSLPKQMLNNSNITSQSTSVNHQISKLTVLGFTSEDCITALNQCDQKLEDAALWLTQNATPTYTHTPKPSSSRGRSLFNISAVEVKANCLSLCIIDDCGDVDVPLLEMSLQELNLSQHLSPQADPEAAEGALECILSSDYYNRVLSGWEPIVEPWKCLMLWNHVQSSNVAKNRLHVTVESQDLLNINITSTLTELYTQVRDSWIQDFYNGKDASKFSESPTNYKRRSPFVPYALKNDTGSPLHFITLITDMNTKPNQNLEVNERWVIVAPGETVPFSFRSRDKMRHRDSHKPRMHQLAVKVEGWQTVTPVTVDKVGIYFRHADAELQLRSQHDTPQARIVFDVALEGTARKLVTIRSPLLVVNQLKDGVELKLDNPLSSGIVNVWASSKSVLIASGTTFAVPLIHTHSHISIRSANETQMYTYCTPYISWAHAARPGESIYELRSCHTNRGEVYRFCAELRREFYPVDRVVAFAGQWAQPGHTITLLPAVLLVNLLPVDLNYSFPNAKSGRILAGNEASITSVDTDLAIKFNLSLENFPASSTLVIPAGCVNGFNCRMRLEDCNGRKLYLQVNMSPNNDAKLKITISVPFWIVNRTGLPLVFRQNGVSVESAGQFAEHEVARMVAPLLFSFCDPDASPTVMARVGNGVICNGSPQWCHQFYLQRGVQVRKLRVTFRDGRPDVIYLVGIEIRTGRGKYRSTSIVTLSPRYHLYNKSSYQLLFAQSCFATTISDPMAQTTYVNVISDSHISFHWPRLDKDQLLCVLIKDIPNCCWSGSLKIDSNYSMHVNVRDIQGRMYFLRLEVVLQDATFFVVFTDADTMPPPIRVDNFSEVPISFTQTCKRDTMPSIARAHTSVPYAWDEPIELPELTIIAPGGVSNFYNMNKLGNVPGLTYENFIYIAFTETFKNGQDTLDPLDVESQQLVLDVEGNRIVLARKQAGQRSQLWRMTSEGQLQHEGSSPPSHPHQTRNDNSFVLDIEGPAPQPTTYSRLVLRRRDPRRKSTQTWRFTEDGRLCCAHFNMCVQAQDGFFGLRTGNAAVLGMPQSICHRVTETGLPIEQAVSRQRLRPGSGMLSVEIITDGPTRVLTIRDRKEKRFYAMSDERDWCSISLKQRPNLIEIEEDDQKDRKEMQLTMNLAGLGVSLISRKLPEELLFARFAIIFSEITLTPSSRKFCVSVKHIQCDNQLFDAPIPVVLYVTPPRNHDDTQHKLPALEIRGEIQPTPNENTVIFKHLIVQMKKLTINLEERLLLKLFAFIGAGSKEQELYLDENEFETQKLLTEVSAAHAKRYYFGVIQLVPHQIRLSMITASKLTSQLQAIKRRLGLTFIKFEDAAVDLKPFSKEHLFETNQFLVHCVIKHFKDELMWQAVMILGSVDFLGNPVGFLNDVSEGVSSLIYEGSVGALVKNVTHGLSNSAAKVTESLSDGLGKVTMDDEHEEMRQKIRQVATGRSGDHLIAGFKGLGFGILGGATGIFKQVYEGAASEGIQGVFSGIGKGLVGAVTKPVVGVLDLASETARAVRDSSRSSSRIVPERTRPPRCILGPGNLLPRYSRKQSQGQQYLFAINDRNYSEQLVAYECLRSGSDDLRIIISNRHVRIVTSSNSPTPTVVIESHLTDVLNCQPVSLREGSEPRHYIEITMRVTGTSAAFAYHDPIKKPRVRCDSAELARTVSQQLNYAKQLFEERTHTLNDNINQTED